MASKTPILARTAKRSTVVPDRPYREYLPALRKDFFYSCAYCTITEFEAQGYSFEIDHYEPQSAKPELQNVYTNLMYSCNRCNKNKLDLDPPSEARAYGNRFVKADEEDYDEQFTVKGDRLAGKTPVGKFSVEFLELNRPALRKLRSIRRELYECEEFVRAGVFALLDFGIDQLPRELRGRALGAKRAVPKVQAEFKSAIDDALRGFAKSELLDAEAEVDLENHVEERKKTLKELRGLYPGSWRGRDKKKKTKETKP